jgi:hypothetical protein
LGKGNQSWTDHFGIQSEVDLDFVIGQGSGYPVGMERESPAEFRRRILAAAISYQLRLKSIDYTLKRYVDADLYDGEEMLLGDSTSDYLRESVEVLMRELRNLHTAHPSFGEFGAEITLFRIPNCLDTARMLSNRGLLLEVLPILRLCVEMMAWSNTAFYLQDENQVMALSAQSCITNMKDVYPTAGKLYGYLSTFSHWGHVIHGHFLDFNTQEPGVGVLTASVRYRAMALALCIVILDAVVEVVRRLYSDRSNILVKGVQGVLERNTARSAYGKLSNIVLATKLKDLVEIQTFLPIVKQA